MRKNTKNETAAKNTTNNTTKTAKTKMEEIMKQAEVKVQIKGNTEPQVEEVKQKRIYRSFKDIILSRIDTKTKGLNPEDFLPIRDKISAALDELQVVIDDSRAFTKTERNINRRLSKFTKEQIEAYLASLPTEE